MDQQTAYQKNKSLVFGNNNSDIVFVLFHGYTGSTDDFFILPSLLEKTYNAHVYVPLLYGHGTTISDLDNRTYKEYIDQVKSILTSFDMKKQKIILGGHSFGGQLALYGATQYPVAGVFTTAVTTRLRFPFNNLLIQKISKVKKYWKKKLSYAEKHERRDAFYYSYMPNNGFSMVNELNTILNKSISQILCPVLSIHSLKDKLAHHTSVYWIGNRLQHNRHDTEIIDNSSHSIYYCKDGAWVMRRIIQFINERIIK